MYDAIRVTVEGRKNDTWGPITDPHSSPITVDREGGAWEGPKIDDLCDMVESQIRDNTIGDD